jgi:cathepsin B
MKTFIAIVLLALSICNHHNKPTITREHIADLKEKAQFEVYSYESHPFKDESLADLRKHLGLKLKSSLVQTVLPTGDIRGDLPTNFVAMDKWPNCIHPIRDQQRCGSCWAFAASEVLSDRFCIASNGKINKVLSPQDMVSCDTGDAGCDGGDLTTSWDYLTGDGIVEDSCFPYTSGQGDSGDCLISGGMCVDGKTKATKYKAAPNYRTFESIEDAKAEIYEKGPIETGFDVYKDFFSYKTGIYKKTSDEEVGGHAVKVVGWGVEDGTNYWVVANSWGAGWGEKGYFRIEIGNCCEFEAGMITGDADVSQRPIY